MLFSSQRHDEPGKADGPCTDQGVYDGVQSPPPVGKAAGPAGRVIVGHPSGFLHQLPGGDPLSCRVIADDENGLFKKNDAPARLPPRPAGKCLLPCVLSSSVDLFPFSRKGGKSIPTNSGFLKIFLIPAAPTPASGRAPARRSHPAAVPGGYFQRGSDWPASEDRPHPSPPAGLGAIRHGWGLPRRR